ncbi:hypothetical protein [Glaciecola sp. 1036]|uniref:hypothetical protein n=1 Tax=Alteromonadaceae TaxID=72275 RepID=UPI003CFE15EB
MTIKDWSRAWITRGFHEQQTYVGATKTKGRQLNAHLVPMQFSSEFSLRERDYKFTKITVDEITFPTIESEIPNSLQDYFSTADIYICESLEVYPSTTDYPVYLSYVLTCLAGCYQVGGLQEVRFFMQHTKGWDSAVIVNDLLAPKYPRGAILQDEIETLLLTELNNHLGLQW